MNKNSILWPLPFIAFAMGYLLIRSFFHIDQFPVPNVLGSSIYQAICHLSNHHLSVRLLNQKEDSDLPDGTIILQIPAPGQLAKPRQTVYLTASKQPEPKQAPQLALVPLDQAEAICKAAGIQLKAHYIESNYPTGLCIAQLPQAGNPLKKPEIIAYISKTPPRKIIWPNFVGLPESQAISFLDEHGITPAISRPKQPSEQHIVTQQRPEAGTIMTLDPEKLPLVQLQIN